ncbi:hypothetical protein ElyMa_000605700 [Elysia marginata]|uniref:Alpha/beta hydrolase fold-5 domain-containing protein n=1 Tax=Elysia marginata TaxID=1093978 RepID=A0AAV4G8D0_9GAST|nr:hypothetical protein ElyMa_000605700 [Elysia marginata]
MSPLASMLGLTFAVLAFSTGSGAVTTTILEPIKSSGDEVGLIFFPGAYIPTDAYNKTARAIQEASDLRVWAALTGGYSQNLVYGWDMEDAVDDAIRELKAAGMKSDAYVGVGHGWGGRFLSMYAPETNLTALILMGATITRKTDLKDYPLPVLTLAGELDGVNKITRVVEEFDKLRDEVDGFFKGVYRNPVVLIKGANHASFVSGELPAQLKPIDLAANISQADAHAMIGRHVNSFLTATFSTDDALVDTALDELVDQFVRTVRKLQPFIDVRNLGTDGEESMWTNLAQVVFAGEYGSQLGVSNELEKDVWFYGEKPTISLKGDDVVVSTYSVVDDEKEPDHILLLPVRESPHEIAMKLISKDAIWKALDSHNDVNLRSQPNTCESLNRLALYLALSQSSKESRERYLASGQPIIFEKDARVMANFLWMPSPLSVRQDREGLHVKSIAMVTKDYHYCKVLPPYRAMEWVNVDSLRAFPNPLI